MLHLETSYSVAQERYRDFVAESANDRLVAAVCGDALPLTRRVARPLGRQLLRLSLLLLRYGKAEAQHTTVRYGSSMSSVELN